MSTGTGIEWTEATWNPVVGCTRASAGCDHCYSVAMTHRLEAMGQSKYKGLTVLNGKGDRHFNGVVRCVPEALTVPLHWRKPRRVFVNSMSDLFHKDVPFEFIDQVFAVMALCPQHTFQVLTKRPERMAEYLDGDGVQHRIARAMDEIEVSLAIADLPERWRDVPDFNGYEVSNHGRVRGSRGEVLSPDIGEQGHCRVTLYRNGQRSRELVHRLVMTVWDRPPGTAEQVCHRNGDATCNALPNLRWGTQAENWNDRKRHGNHRSYQKLTQDQVDEIRKLLSSGHPAERLGRRFNVSATQIRNIGRGDQWSTDGVLPWPLSAVWLGTSCEDQATADERVPHLLRCPAAVRFISAEPLLGPVTLPLVPSAQCQVPGISWLIVGGESGGGARPCNIDWIRSIIQQCKDAGVPCFVKQLGKEPRETEVGPSGRWSLRSQLDRKGGDWAEWPEDLRVREFPDGAVSGCQGEEVKG